MSEHAYRLLELEDQPRFHRLERRLTQFGWIALTLFVLAGLLGLLGPGPLSRTVTGDPGDTVRVDHHRIGHYDAEDSMTLLLSQEALEGDTLTVELTGPWLQGSDISAVNPEPDAQRTVEDGVRYEFAVERAADVDVTITFRAQQLGRLPLTVEAGGSTTRLTQLVLP